MLDSLALEIDFPIFNRISSFYNLLKDSLTIQNYQPRNSEFKNISYFEFHRSLKYRSHVITNSNPALWVDRIREPKPFKVRSDKIKIRRQN